MAIAPTRIYVVHDAASDEKRLVRARSASQAVASIVAPRFAASVASQDTLVSLLQSGIVVTNAAKPPAEHPPIDAGEAGDLDGEPL